MAKKDCVIKIENLKKYFGKVKAVDGVSFDVNRGEIFGFLGPNGAGKTTAIRCMMDFLRPDKGVITILGQNAQKDSTSLKKQIGFLAGEVHLYNNWTGQEHINLVKKVRGSDDFAKELISKLDFDPAKKAKNLSSGNKQKLALVLTLMHQPQVLIMDEPTLGLDPLLQNTIYETLYEQRRKGTTIFLSSHNLSEVERICDRVCIIKNGQVAAIESIFNLKKKRIYTVYAYFEGTVPTMEELSALGLEIKEELVDGFSLTVKGDIDPIIALLNKYNLKDLEITHASLEEVFLEYYK